MVVWGRAYVEWRRRGRERQAREVLFGNQLAIDVEAKVGTIVDSGGMIPGVYGQRGSVSIVV